MSTRRPAVAGKFYSGSKTKLEEEIAEIYKREEDRIERDLGKYTIAGGIVPHAGYGFSAYHAVHFFDILRNHVTQFDTVVIVNPNHSGYGNPISLDENDKWETPLGIAEVDMEMAELLGYPKNSAAHKFEHSGEVMVPLLQYFLDYSFKILPVSMGEQTAQNAKTLAEKIRDASNELDTNITIVASSDFSHFLPKEEGKRKDNMVVEKIQALDTDGIENTVKSNNLSVCGYGPIMTLMEYGKLTLDSPKIKELSRGSSGDVIPSSEVVDYITFLMYA